MSDAIRSPWCWDLVLLGCGKAKRRERAAAIDLYTDPAYKLPLRERVRMLQAEVEPLRPAFGPPSQPAVLVLAGAPYIDGWLDRARALGVLVDDPLRGYELGERRRAARRFVAETPARPAGCEGEDPLWGSRREQLLGFIDALELERASVDDLADEPVRDQQLDLRWWAEDAA